jgi:anti-sigma factor RsiW
LYVGSDTDAFARISRLLNRLATVSLMMKPASTETPGQDAALLLHAYFDGELDPANAVSVKQQVDADPRLAGELANISALQKVLRARFPREPIPANLQTRINAATGLHRRLGRPTWAAMAASILLAVVLSSGSTWVALRAPQADQTITEIVDGHVRSLMSATPIDVASSERHIVKPWFNGRLPQSPQVLDLSSEGFPLIGARIDVIGAVPVPTLVYGRRLHKISLTAVPTSSSLPDVMTSRSVNGYNVVSWSSGQITYWAASDLNVRELEEFAKLFKSSPG